MRSKKCRISLNQTLPIILRKMNKLDRRNHGSAVTLQQIRLAFKQLLNELNIRISAAPCRATQLILRWLLLFQWIKAKTSKWNHRLILSQKKCINNREFADSFAVWPQRKVSKCRLQDAQP
jgi:hypothetical protein